VTSRSNKSSQPYHNAIRPTVFQDDRPVRQDKMDRQAERHMSQEEKMTISCGSL